MTSELPGIRQPVNGYAIRAGELSGLSYFQVTDTAGLKEYRPELCLEFLKKGMETVSIKKATADDIEQLQQIGRQTFYESFSSHNTEENMRRYLAERFSHEKMTMELKYADSEFYFAQKGPEIIGYLKINFGNSQTEMKNENALEIERIYVLREFQGKKVGQLLFQKALEVAKQKNVDYVWLGVWEKNAGAIRFYQRHGFVEFDKHIFRLGDDEQTDMMMMLPLE